MAEGVRYGLLVRTCLEVLRDSGVRMHGRAVLDEVAKRIELTEAELRLHNSGTPAWNVAARFHTRRDRPPTRRDVRRELPPGAARRRPGAGGHAPALQIPRWRRARDTR